MANGAMQLERTLRPEFGRREGDAFTDTLDPSSATRTGDYHHFPIE
jgi:hypothetical protein